MVDVAHAVHLDGGQGRVVDGSVFRVMRAAAPEHNDMVEGREFRARLSSVLI